MFWNKGKKERDIEHASVESLQVASFYHAVASDAAWGSPQAKYVAYELNTFRTHEIAEMVILRMKGVTDYNEMRAMAEKMIPTFNQHVNDYWLKKYGNRKYEKECSQNN